MRNKKLKKRKMTAKISKKMLMPPTKMTKTMVKLEMLRKKTRRKRRKSKLRSA
jgi:hypothetical protein